MLFTSLLPAAVLVLLQCISVSAHSIVINRKTLDNEIQTNDFPATRSYLRNMVHITQSPPEAIQVKSGTRMVLQCEVFGKPAPTVQWLKNGELDADVLPSGDLLINPLLWADMGNFTCIAKNMYGRDTKTTFLYPLKPTEH